MISYGLIKGLQWKSTISFSFIYDLARRKQNTSDNSIDVLIVRLRDSKNKRCRDQDFSGPEMLPVGLDTLRPKAHRTLTLSWKSQSCSHLPWTPSFSCQQAFHQCLKFNINKYSLKRNKQMKLNSIYPLSLIPVIAGCWCVGGHSGWLTDILTYTSNS